MRERPEHGTDPAIAAVGMTPPALRTAAAMPARQRSTCRERRTQDVGIGGLAALGAARILRPQRGVTGAAAPHRHRGRGAVATGRSRGRRRSAQRRAARRAIRTALRPYSAAALSESRGAAPASASPRRDLDMTTELTTELTTSWPSSSAKRALRRIEKTRGGTKCSAARRSKRRGERSERVAMRSGEAGTTIRCGESPDLGAQCVRASARAYCAAAQRLAGIDQIGIVDLLAVGVEDHRVAGAVAVSETAAAPTGCRRGRSPGCRRPPPVSC